MEFHEKLQELRKSRGLTQEELAENLYVSRTAVSKWESGRGYPSIDSLKEISNYFSVSIDDLLSGEKVLSIAEEENRINVQNVCDLVFGIVDMCTFLLIVLPLYPNPVGEYIYSVNLFNYVETTPLNLLVFSFMYVVHILLGIIKVVSVKSKAKKGRKLVTDISMGFSVLLVLLLALTREAYAIVIAFLLLVIKGLLLLRRYV